MKKLMWHVLSKLTIIQLNLPSTLPVIGSQTYSVLPKVKAIYLLRINNFIKFTWDGKNIWNISLLFPESNFCQLFYFQGGFNLIKTIFHKIVST